MTDLEVMYLDFGALEYSNEIIAKITGTSISGVVQNMSGKLGELYQEGKFKFNYSVDKKLMEMATNGDVKSLQELNKRKNLRQLNVKG